MRVPVPGRRWSPVESQKGPVVMLYLVILVQLKNETSMIAATGCPLHQPMSQTPLWRLQGRGGKETETRAVPTSPRNAVQVDHRTKTRMVPIPGRLASLGRLSHLDFLSG